MIEWFLCKSLRHGFVSEFHAAMGLIWSKLDLMATTLYVCLCECGVTICEMMEFSSKFLRLFGSELHAMEQHHVWWHPQTELRQGFVYCTHAFAECGYIQTKDMYMMNLCGDGDERRKWLIRLRFDLNNNHVRRRNMQSRRSGVQQQIVFD